MEPPYSIDSLTANLNKKGSKQVGDAKTELLALHNHDSNGLVVNTELVAAFKKLRDDFTTRIHGILLKLKAIKVEKIVIGEGVNEKSYPIMELTKPANIEKKYDDLPTAAQTEFTNLLANKVDVVKITTFYKGILNIFLREIRDILLSFSEIFWQIGRTNVPIADVGEPFEIGNLMIVVDESLDLEEQQHAEKELIVLYNYDFGRSIVKTELETALQKIKNDFWEEIKPVLGMFLELKVEYIDTNSEYSVIDLLKPENIEKQHADLSYEAKIEFIILLEENFNKKKLQIAYQKILKHLDSFLFAIKPTLQTFKETHITEVTIDGTTYPIADLAANLNKKGSKQTGDAKTELINLYNYNPNFEMVKKKLDAFVDNTKIETFKAKIQVSLNNLAKINVKLLQIDNKNYSVKELLKVNTDSS